MKFWLTVEEAAPFLGETPDMVYRTIREGDFPWEYVKLGRKIKISARSIGLISTLGDLIAESRKSETRSQEALAETACDRAVIE